MVFKRVLTFWASCVSLALAWQNSYDGRLDFECDNNQYIARIQSHHDNHHEDRLWEYSCKTIPAGAQLDKCTWYNNVNAYDGLLSFRCRGQQVIAGVKSVHDNHHEDRVFSFRCCSLEHTSVSACQMSQFINNYDGDMDYTIPNDYVIVGFQSEESDHYEDRRWKAEICELPRG